MGITELFDINKYAIDSSVYKNIYDKENPNLLHLLAHENDPWVILIGGTRSGKTYSALRYLLYKALKTENFLTISVVSMTMPHLRRGALRDFEDILKNNKIPYDQNKTLSIFYFPNARIEFFSSDQEGKVRGPQRDILFVNEANLIEYDILEQLFIRTSKQVIMDMNPTNPFFVEKLVKEKKIPKENILRTTYRDNPHLSTMQVEQIEGLSGVWAEMYKEGKFVLDSFLAFYSYSVISDSEYNERRQQAKVKIWGVDFGEGRSPTAVVEVFKTDSGFYAKELLYADIDLDSLLAFLSTKDKATAIVADPAQKHAIDYIARKVRITPAKKPHLASSYAILNNAKIKISDKSQNLLNEAMTLKIKDTETFALQGQDHAVDALRYAIHAFYDL